MDPHRGGIYSTGRYHEGLLIFVKMKSKFDLLIGSAQGRDLLTNYMHFKHFYLETSSRWCFTANVFGRLIKFFALSAQFTNSRCFDSQRAAQYPLSGPNLLISLG